jgi:acetyl esterase/lipase
MAALQALITSHPGKFLWALLAIGFNMARLPFWMLYYLPPSTRPTKKWSYNQAIRRRILHAFLTNGSLVEMKTPESLKPGKEGKQFVVIEPAPSSSYTGIVLKDNEIKPKAIGGTWYPAPLGKFEGKEEVVLHFHGGAFVVGDGRKDDAGPLAKTILDNTPATHVFCPQYRLSSNPLGRFPAALQDAITSIQHLVQVVGVPANRMTVSGDSAGGNIALALLRYIHDQPEAKVPSPSAAFLWSPWADPSRSMITGAFDGIDTDYIPENFGTWGAKAYKPIEASGITLLNPHIRFVENPFLTPTALFISTGECEALYKDIIKTYEGLKAIEGNKVELRIEEGAPHDSILVSQLSGWGSTAIETAKAAGVFLQSLKR